MKTTRQKLSLLSLAACLGSSLLLGACTSTTPNYYTLAANVKSLPSEKVRVIELLPVGLPDRLDRTQMVVQDASGQSKVMDLQRWTSTLSSELRDGLSSELQQRLGAVDRYHSGATTMQSAYRIAADFAHFDGLSGAGHSSGEVNVAVTWTISRVDDPLSAAATLTTRPKPIACRMAFSTPFNTASNNEIDRMVDASRQSLARVAAAITTSVLSLEGSAKNTDAVCG